MQHLPEYICDKLSPIYKKNEAKSLSQWIIESIFGIKPHEISLCKDKEISPNERQRIEDILLRLLNHEPIQYILGETEFFGMSFSVNPDVLIPRPETEELVEWIIREHGEKTTYPLQILDIGTGSGCIAVSLAKHLPDANVYAIDISEQALETAKHNASINNVCVLFIRQDIFKPISSDIFPKKWDIIVSNPPYISVSEQKNMEKNVLEYEPHTALFVSDKTPLIFYEQIAEFGKKHLNENGAIYVETSALYGQKTAEMFCSQGYQHVDLRKDISGRDRMIKAENVSPTPENKPDFHLISLNKTT